MTNPNFYLTINSDYDIGNKFRSQSNVSYEDIFIPQIVPQELGFHYLRTVFKLTSLKTRDNNTSFLIFVSIGSIGVIADEILNHENNGNFIYSFRQSTSSDMCEFCIHNPDIMKLPSNEGISKYENMIVLKHNDIITVSIFNSFKAVNRSLKNLDRDKFKRFSYISMDQTKETEDMYEIYPAFSRAYRLVALQDNLVLNPSFFQSLKEYDHENGRDVSNLKKSIKLFNKKVLEENNSSNFLHIHKRIMLHFMRLIDCKMEIVKIPQICKESTLVLVKNLRLVDNLLECCLCKKKKMYLYFCSDTNNCDKEHYLKCSFKICKTCSGDKEHKEEAIMTS